MERFKKLIEKSTVVTMMTSALIFSTFEHLMGQGNWPSLGAPTTSERTEPFVNTNNFNVLDYVYDPCTGQVRFEVYLKDQQQWGYENMLRVLNVKVNGNVILKYHAIHDYWDSNVFYSTPLSGSNVQSHSITDIPGNGSPDEVTFYVDYDGAVSFRNSGDYHYMGWAYELPNTPSGDIDVEIYVNWNKTDGSGGVGTPQFGAYDVLKYTTDLAFEPLSAPAAPSVSKLADEVGYNLSWNPVSGCAGNSSELTLMLKRFVDDGDPSDDIPDLTVTGVAGNATSYRDNDGVDQCETYYYTLTPVAGNVEGEVSSYDPPDATRIIYTDAYPEPSNLQATTNTCNGEITVTWDWYTTSPDRFSLESSTDNVNFAQVDWIAGSKRKHVDNVGIAQRNIPIYYRVRTDNGCRLTPVDDLTAVEGWSFASPDADPTDISLTQVSDGIQISWADHPTNEEGFTLVRTRVGGGTKEFDVVAGSSTYIDKDVAICEAYSYALMAYNQCGQSATIESDELSVSVDISPVLQPASLEVSKGYFAERIALKWEADQAVANYIDRYHLYRRQLGSSVAPELLATINGNARSFDDDRSEASLLYEYFIVGESDCGLSIIQSYDIAEVVGKDYEMLSLSEGLGYGIGLRTPVAVVNGNIAYAGGIGVKDVKVVVDRESGVSGNALYFDGVDDHLEIVPKKELVSSEAATVSFWFRPEILSGTQTLLSITDRLEINLINDLLSVEFKVSGIWQSIDIAEPLDAEVFQTGQYYNLTATFDGTEIIGYINGRERTKKAVSGTLVADLSTMTLGKHTNVGGQEYMGYLDELRFHEQALDSITVARAHGRYLDKSEYGLTGYWRMDEATGPYVFDLSNTGGVYNKNDGERKGVLWSEQIPSVEQLGMAGYTSTSGNYTVAGIAYTGVGENFIVRPTFTLTGVTHAFSPADKVVFLGEGNSVQNEVDFEDISSFQVSGRVMYDYHGNQDIGVEGASLLIDGLPVSDDLGQVVKTGTDGTFAIQVPIGEHVISVQHGSHVFAGGGYWPSADTPYDFQDQVSGIMFFDHTVKKVAGRIVGGTREGDKPLGFGQSVNNIGQAQFDLTSLNDLLNIPIITHAATGEYEVEVPPIQYKIVDPTSASGEVGIDIASNPALNFDGLENIDLTAAFVEFTDRDTVRNGEGEITAINEYNYHHKANFVYREDPVVSVSNTSDNAVDPSQFGDEHYLYVNPNDQSEEQIVLISGGHYTLGRPVFSRANEYKFKIKVSENYTNYDGGGTVLDEVPVTDASIEITNNIGQGYHLDAQGQKTNYSAAGSATDEIVLSSASGDTTYIMKPLEPNVNIDLGDPEKIYTKSFSINVVAGGNSVVWNLPNAYVMGAKATSQNFITRSPDLVEFVLRDPPGSNSYTYIEEGTSTTVSSSFSTNAGLGLDTELGVGVGTNTLVGGGLAGVGEITETYAVATIGANVSTSVGETNELVSTFDFTQTIETNSDNINVGAAGDLFVGKSENYLYGVSDNLVLVPVSTCGSPEVYCVEETADEFADPVDQAVITGLPKASGATEMFTLARKVGFFLVPNGDPTYFVYSQNHIENYLIPDLIALRNTVLTSNASYLNHAGEDKFGTNNDDPVWGARATSNDPVGVEPADFDGDSYSFLPATDADDTNDDEIDSVRWYNQQIRLWQETIAQNEKAKVEAIAGGLKENFSLSGGSTLSQNKATSVSNTTTMDFNMSTSLSAGADMQFDGFGLGFNMSMQATVSLEVGASSSTGVENSTTYGFVLDDPDVGDFMSVNVYGSDYGSSPIFELVAGQTMCPHEPEIFTKYHQPGTPISGGSMQREVPRIEVENAVIYNVPADEQAAFNLTLYNESESGDDQYYSLQVLDYTNPDGAIVAMDGSFFDGRRQLFVPGGKSITKTLTMAKGPVEYDYENIEIVMHSTCQFDATDNDINISDSLTIAAHFLPVCTELEITAPLDQWVANFDSQDTVSVVIDEFNINYPGLQAVTLEYKPSANSSWTQIEKFYKTSADPETLLIPKDNPVISYNWLIKDINDGYYDLRAYATCDIPATGGQVSEYSPVRAGLVDRVTPHPFGNPLPADGVLSANDEILIQFNEPINSGVLTATRFDIRGELNGGELRHEAAASFDGVSQYIEIPSGINLTGKSFSIEFYLKRDVLGEAVLISQGAHLAADLLLSLNASNEIVFRMQGQEVTATTVRIDDLKWHHLAVTYDHEAKNLMIIKDASDASKQIFNSYTPTYLAKEKIWIGKSIHESLPQYAGVLHELRIWNKALSQGEIASASTQRQSRTTPNLIANWVLEEAVGSFGEEKVKGLHAEVKTGWKVYPGGLSLDFDGSSYAKAKSPAIISQQNYTIEFWFNTLGTDEVLLSNGKGDGTDNNPSGWSFGIDSEGHIYAMNNGQVISASTLVNDGKWHHLALSRNQFTSTNLFLDAQEVASVSSDLLRGFSGASIYLGARGYYLGPVETIDRHYSGLLDEVRIWRTDRSLAQIEGDQYHKLSGDEAGLLAYYPCETYVDMAGVLVSQSSGENLIENPDVMDADDLTITGIANYSSLTPTIKLPRPLQKVNFSYSANGDRIILSPTDDAGRVEHVILDIAVNGIQDLNGNVLQYPVTWKAYVDRNQVVWLEDALEIDKPLNEPYSFSTSISNTGGTIYNYEISNMPNWLTVSPASGTIAPLSQHKITFEISEGLHIGNHQVDLYLTTDFGFGERLSIETNVSKPLPEEWQISPEDYTYTMSVIAQVKLNEMISRDPEVVVAAMVGGEFRGLAKLEYIEAFDNYQAFLSVYSNVSQGEAVNFQVWNAAQGRIHAHVSPELTFESNKRYGNLYDPLILEVPDYIRSEITLKNGWQWLSFNLQATEMNSVNGFLANLDATEGDILKGQNGFDKFDPEMGWFGTLTAKGGLTNGEMYKLKVAGDKRFAYEGEIPDPTSKAIQIQPGWNWVGFISQVNLTVNEALAGFDATPGDEIKGQRQFAVYQGSSYGWIGTLEVLVPDQGYMIHAAGTGSFTFPKQSGLAGSGRLMADQGEGLTHYRQFASNMSMIVELYGIDADRLDVYAGDELRGQAVPLSVNQRTYYFVTVYGEGAGDVLSFKAITGSVEHDLVATTAISYEATSRHGTLGSPVELRPTDVLSATAEPRATSIYPNPSAGSFEVGFWNDAGEVTLSISSLSGQKLWSQTFSGTGYSTRQLDAQLFKEPGVYLLKILNGNKVETRKLIKQ